MQRTDSLEKIDAGKDWKQEEKGTIEDETIGWHLWLDAHDFEQAPGVGDGQGCLAWCSPWSLKELDTTEQLKGNNKVYPLPVEVECSRENSLRFQNGHQITSMLGYLVTE